MRDLGSPCNILHPCLLIANGVSIHYEYFFRYSDLVPHYTMDDLVSASHRLGPDLSDPKHHTMDELF